ncbi:MAG: hypothetical protein KAR38_01060 [Calditrichia bacterium]|nr:hypothetical protein [Calditrichia bacterium]
MKGLLYSILILLFITVFNLSAQSEYFDKNESGSFLNVGMANREDQTSLGAGIGYSFSGFADVSARFSTLVNYTGYLIIPSFGINLIKSKQDNPFSLTARMGSVYYSNDGVSEGTNFNALAGIDIFKHSNKKIILEGGYSFLSFRSYKSKVFNLGFTFLNKSPSGNIAFGPYITLNEEKPIWGFSISFMQGKVKEIPNKSEVN